METLRQILSRQSAAAQHSETLLINEVSSRMAAENRTVYRFGFGQSPFPVPDRVVEALRTHAHAKHYAPVQGLPELRGAMAEFHNAMEGFSWTADELIVGAGSKILLYCLMAAVADADVLLVSPSWVSYEPQAGLAGHPVYRIHTRLEDDWRLAADAVDDFCRTRPDQRKPLIFILNYPGNPDGGSYTGEELSALAGVLRRHQVLVISDEIYGLLNHRGEHVSLSAYYPEGTVVTGGLSKWCGAGGWRLGMARIPPQLGDAFFRRVVGIASETYSCVTTPVQLAAICAYEVGAEVRSYLEQQRHVLSRIGSDFSHRLRQAGVAVSDPRGGFYLFPDFAPHRESLAKRGIVTGHDFTRTLLDETGVALLPGSAFGMDRDSLTARLAYVDFDGANALLTGVADTFHMDEGIQRLCDWLNAT